jgi:hypothetical protein
MAQARPQVQWMKVNFASLQCLGFLREVMKYPPRNKQPLS